MRLRSLASLRPWLYPYNIEIIYIPISIIYYLVSYYGTVFLCINLLLTFTVIQPAAAKVINKQINQKIKSKVLNEITDEFVDEFIGVIHDVYHTKMTATDKKAVLLIRWSSSWEFVT